MQNDENLIVATANGDESAFEELVEKYKLIVFNIIYQYLCNNSETEDVAQEVFIKVWKHAGTFNPKYKFSTWIYRITVNTCLNYKKSNKTLTKHYSLDDIEESGNTDTPEKLSNDTPETKERNEIISEALLTLPSNQKMALILSQFERRSYKEIAEIMEISVSAVESLIFRAKSNMKKQLLPLKVKNQL